VKESAWVRSTSTFLFINLPFYSSLFPLKKRFAEKDAINQTKKTTGHSIKCDHKRDAEGHSPE